MIKKIILSLLIIGGVGASAVGATQALLADTATLSANTFSTGTPDLLIGKGQTGTPQDISIAGFNQSILPGQTITNYIRLKNNSNTGINFSIAAQAVVTGEGISRNDVTVAFTPVNTSEVAIGPAVSGTLADWTGGASLGSQNVNAGSTQQYKMEVTLSSGVTTGGVSSVFDFIFTGTQVGP